MSEDGNADESKYEQKWHEMAAALLVAWPAGRGLPSLGCGL